MNKRQFKKNQKRITQKASKLAKQLDNLPIWVSEVPEGYEADEIRHIGFYLNKRHEAKVFEAMEPYYNDIKEVIIGILKFRQDSKVNLECAVSNLNRFLRLRLKSLIPVYFLTYNKVEKRLFNDIKKELPGYNLY